jgi:hypothetical protein
VTEEGNTGLTWENRLALSLPRPLLFGALLLAVCISAAYIGFQWFFDLRVEPGAFGIVLFITWTLIAPRYLLAPLDRHEMEVRALQIHRAAIHVSRFTGAAVVFAFVGLWELLMVLQGRDLFSSWFGLHDNSATMVLFLSLGWSSGRVGYLSFAGGHRYISLPQRSDIDLLNLEDLYVFGRSGLRGTLVLYIILATAGLLILPGLGSGLWVIVPFFAINLGLGIFMLLMPARKVRSLIREVKREELARLDPLLRQARDDTLAGNASTQGRLTDLVTYKSQVESTPEWPFDSSTLLRFGLYLLIPVASMVGGALVERVVDTVLD